MFERNREVAAMILMQALLDQGLSPKVIKDVDLIEVLDQVFAALEIEVEWEA